MYNDPDIVRLIRVATRDLVGAQALVPATPMMGAEDFSYMSRLAPGAMFMLGARKDATTRPHHTPICAAVLADVACRLLRQKAS